MRWTSGNRRAHPHSRGENKRTNEIQSCSPLMRGKRREDRFTLAGLGLIPAHAGKTSTPSPPRAPSKAHPHSYGENYTSVRSPLPSGGSSPLMQGKQSDGLVMAIHERLIPDHAGKPSSGSRRASGGRAHPRSRGEDEYLKRGSFISPGSSPLTRGKRRKDRLRLTRLGLIPAHAGKTVESCRSRPEWRAHPRSRRENPQSFLAKIAVMGSSPLTRGKRQDAVRLLVAVRLIPAHEGKTSACQRRPAA